MRWKSEYYDPTNHAAVFLLLMLVLTVVGIGVSNVFFGPVPIVVWIALGFGVALFLVVASFTQSNHEVHLWVEEGWLQIDARKRLKIDLDTIATVELGQLDQLYTLDVTYRTRHMGWQVRLSESERVASEIVAGVQAALDAHRERFGTPDEVPRAMAALVSGARE